MMTLFNYERVVYFMKSQKDTKKGHKIKHLFFFSFALLYNLPPSSNIYWVLDLSAPISF